MLVSGEVTPGQWGASLLGPSARARAGALRGTPVCLQGLAPGDEGFQGLRGAGAERLLVVVQVRLTNFWPSFASSAPVRVRPPGSLTQSAAPQNQTAFEKQVAPLTCEQEKAVRRDRAGTFQGDTLPALTRF